jgi:hypothetical protein
MRWIRLTIAVLVAASCALTPPAARAADPEGVPQPVNLPWERTLPAQPTRTDIQPHAVPGCRDGGLRCIARVERRLRAQFKRLDAGCDHRVIASLAYLRITQALRKDLSRRHPRFFRHKRWMAYVITDFSNSYFTAFRNYERGRPVPEAWRQFYDEATAGDANALQDLLAFSNAHAQHDLPFTYASMGLRTPSGASRKVDHDGVNEINVRVIPGVKAEIERRYDPSVRDVPGPLDEMGGLEPTKSWREGAWRNAERLVSAPDEASRSQAADQIRAYSAAWGRLIAESPRIPGTRAARDAHCRAFHAAARKRSR